jgi:hypothetical protein
MASWGGVNNIYATLASPNATSTAWSLPVTITGNRELKIMAKTFAVTGGSDPTKATKKIETFGLEDATPTTSITGPSGSVLTKYHLHRHGHRQRRQRGRRPVLLVPQLEQPVPAGRRERLVQLQHLPRPA